MPGDQLESIEETVLDKEGQEIQLTNNGLEEHLKDDGMNGSSGSWKVLTVDGEIEPVKEGRRGRKRSQIWGHFKKTEGKLAKCCYCDQVLSYAGSLSNLFRHTRKKHPVIASHIQLSGNHSNSVVLDSTVPLNELILDVDGSGQERLVEPLSMVKTEPGGSSCMKKMKASDIEFVFKRDHSYIEQPSLHLTQPQTQRDGLFAQFIQSEINKFRTEILKRKCKREILQALMKYQQQEDDLYSSTANDDV